MISVTKRRQTKPYRWGYATYDVPLFEVVYDGEDVTELAAELGGWNYEGGALWSAFAGLTVKLLNQALPLLLNGDIEAGRAVVRIGRVKAAERFAESREAWCKGE